MKFDEKHFARQEQALGFLTAAREYLRDRDGGAWNEWEGAGTIHQPIVDRLRRTSSGSSPRR